MCFMKGIKKLGDILVLYLFIPCCQSEECYGDICLEDNYNKQIPPNITGKNDPVEVTLELVLYNIYKVDHKLNTVTINLGFAEVWHENRIINVANQTKALPIGLMTELWLPDLMVHNTQHMELGKTFTPHQGLWLVSGSMMYSAIFDVTVVCNMEFYRFPFDSHICPVRFGSLNQLNDSIVFKLGIPPKWEIKTKTLIVREYQINLLELSEEEQWITNQYEGHYFHQNLVGFKVELIRRPLRYLVMYYIPSAMFVVVSWVSFLIPPSAYPARIALLITTFLVLINIFNNVASSTPSEAEGLTAIAIWLLATIFFVFASLLCYVILLIKIRLSDSIIKVNPKDSETVDNKEIGPASVETKPSSIFEQIKPALKRASSDKESKIDLVMLIILSFSFAIFIVVYYCFI